MLEEREASLLLKEQKIKDLYNQQLLKFKMAQEQFKSQPNMSANKLKSQKQQNSNIFNSQNNNTETIYNYTPMEDNSFRPMEETDVTLSCNGNPLMLSSLCNMSTWTKMQ